MIPFAVHHEGIPDVTGPDGQTVPGGRWVIAVEGERLLLSEDDGTLYWRDLADCKLIRVQTPDMPQMVLPVAPPQDPRQIVTAPALPRAERRAMAFGR